MSRVLMMSAAWLAACGGGSPSDGGTLAYFPLAVGNAWTYLVSDTSGTNAGTTREKTTQVEAYEEVGGEKPGVMAYRFLTDKGTGKTVSWQRVAGNVLQRHREQSFDLGELVLDELYEPYKLRLSEEPEHLAQGATFSQAYVELAHDLMTGIDSSRQKSDQWTVEQTAESITVPAGTFPCLRLRRVSSPSGSDKTYWFAEGIGKVKEVGAGQTEELVAYELVE